MEENGRILSDEVASIHQQPDAEAPAAGKLVTQEVTENRLKEKYLTETWCENKFKMCLVRFFQTCKHINNDSTQTTLGS